MSVNPYETDLNKIPDTDLYKDTPLYGRYLHSPEDFHPDPDHDSSPAYWEQVLAKCGLSNSLHPPIGNRRDVFALGSVIIKSNHLRGEPLKRDCHVLDQNERLAIELARPVLSEIGIEVPIVHFAGKIQKQSFKDQARSVVQLLRRIKPDDSVSGPSYLFPDHAPEPNRGISKAEKDLLFGIDGNSVLSLGHNDLNPSNIIVQNDKIVGIIDWEMAGWFDWRKVGQVHSQLRTPRPENFKYANISEERIADITFWNNLYNIPS